MNREGPVCPDDRPPSLAQQAEEVQRLRRRVDELEATCRALADSQERSRHMLLNVPVGLVVLSPERKILSANPAFCDLVEYAEEELRGRDPWDITLPEDRGIELPQVQRLLRGEIPSVQVEKRYLSKSGKAVWALLTSTVVRNAEGAVQHCLSVVESIDRRKQAERELLISRSALESTISGIVLCDMDGRVTYANPSAMRMWGYQDDREVLGRQGREFWYEPDVVEGLKQVLSENRHWIGEVVARRKDGGRFDAQVSASLVLDDDGRPICFMASTLDVTARKQAEQELRDNQERFRRIFDDGPVGMALAGRDCRIIRANHALTRMLGYADGELTGKSLAELTHPDDVPRDLVQAEQLMTGARAAYSKEKRYRTKDGRILWTSLTASLVRDDLGRPLYAVMIVEDVTEQRKTRQALQQSEQRFRKVFQESAVGMVLVDADLRLTRVNRTFREMLKYPEQELLGMTVDQITHPEDRGVAGALKGKVFSGQTSRFQLDKRFVARDGAIVWASVTGGLIHDEPGQPPYVVAVVEDTTVRKQAEDALRESEARYRLLVEHLPVITYTAALDERSTTTYVSPQVQELLGYTRAEYVENPDLWAQRLFPEDRERVLWELRRSRAAGVKFDAEYRMLTRDNQVRWFRDQAYVVPGEAGQPARLQGVMHDVTAAKQAEDALRVLHHNLMSARETERRALAGELHDSIGQGLIALQLGLRGIADQGGSASGTASSAVETLMAQCDGLVNEVRRICHGLYPPTLESLGLVAALRQLARDFYSGQVAVRCSREAAAGRFRPEIEIALFRVTQESVANALRHGQAAKVRVDLAFRKGQLVLKVADDGLGFDVETTLAAGAGLGLSTMQDRAQAVGGELKIASRPGRTTVSVRVPTAQAGQGAPAPAASAEVSRRRARGGNARPRRAGKV